MLRLRRCYPRRTCNQLIVFLFALLSILLQHLIAATSTKSQSTSPLSTLLQLSSSSSSALLKPDSTSFHAWTSATDRHYALLIFVTASEQCAACARVEAEIGKVAIAYEKERYTQVEEESDENDDEESFDRPSRHPQHHIFFLSFDAHLIDRTQSSISQRHINLPYFLQHEIRKVPELFLLMQTTPGNSSEEAAEEELDHEEDDVVSSYTHHRKSQRLEAMHIRRRKRYAQRERILIEAANQVLKQQNATDPEQQPATTLLHPLPATAANGIANAAVASNSTLPPPLNWRDPSQIRVYPVQSGMTASQLLVFVREHTEGGVMASSATQKRRRSTRSKLPRSLVVRPGSLNLTSIMPSSSSSTPSSILTFLSSFSPFLPSISFLLLMIGLVRACVLPFIILPILVYFWSIIGTMNNILKGMTLIGMSPERGVMLLYPGNGSFILESLIVGAIYAGCAFTLVAINTMPLWNRKRLRRLMVDNRGEDPLDDRQPPIEFNFPPGTVFFDNGETIYPPPSSSILRSPNPLDLTPALWIIILMFTLHLAFAILRMIYTRKIPRYQAGYLWP